MPSNVLTIFDSRLSKISIFISLPPDANKFPLLWQTSIQNVMSIRSKCKIKEEAKYKQRSKKIASQSLVNEKRKPNSLIGSPFTLLEIAHASRESAEEELDRN